MNPRTPKALCGSTARGGRRVIVLPQISDFQSRFPDIDLTISLGDGPVDLIQEGLDLDIRAGELASSTSSRAVSANSAGCYVPRLLTSRATVSRRPLRISPRTARWATPISE